MIKGDEKAAILLDSMLDSSDDLIMNFSGEMVLNMDFVVLVVAAEEA